MNETLSRPTLAQRLRDRVEARRNGDAGLALLDVLLGMAIFALIVIIAIQAIGQFRQRAYQTAANSDAQQLSIGIESYMTDSGTQAPPAVGGTTPNFFPDWDGAATVASATDATGLGVNLTKNDSIFRYTKDDATSSYTFCILHKTGTTVDAWSFYDSSKGAITKDGRGAPAAFNASTSPCGV